MKRIILVALMCFGLVGCSPALSESYNEEELQSLTETVLENLNAGDYETITEQVTDDLKSGLSPDVLKSAWGPISEKLGEYKKVEDMKCIGNQDNSATVILLAKYEHGRIQLTTTYNQQMEIIGLYIK